jgi:DNA-binding IclR family transcriptional regulator
MTQSPAQFAIRTMRALEVLAFGPMTAPQLADHLGVHPRTARRLLSQLQRDGWLAYSPTFPPTYAPTLRLVALAAQVGARSPLAEITAPALERLHAVTGRPAILAIPSYDSTVCVVRCVGEAAADAPLGVIEPAHETAHGKVLLAHRPAWRRSVLERLQDVDVTELDRELDQARRDGYAVADSGTAAPVAVRGAEPLIALGVLGPRADDSLRRRVCLAAARASERLASVARREPLHRTVVYRQLAAYGLAEVDAHL